MTDPIREAIQRYLLDVAGDGWSVTQLVISMGLERINSEGNLETTAWYWAPKDQPAWQTAGLLDQAQDMHNHPPDDDEDDL